MGSYQFHMGPPLLVCPVLCEAQKKRICLLLWVNVCDVFLCMCGCVCHCVCSCVVVCVCVSMWAGLRMAFETSAFIITIPSSSPSSYQGLVHHHHSHFLITSSSWISLRPTSPSSSFLSSVALHCAVQPGLGCCCLRRRLQATPEAA